MNHYFSPLNGHAIRGRFIPAQWRRLSSPWVFNPYTGFFREAQDVENDPQGFCISLAGEPLKVAKRSGTRCVAALPSGYNRVAIFKGTFITTSPNEAPLYLAENGTWQPLHYIDIPGVA